MSSNIKVKNIENNQQTNIGLPLEDVMICDNEIITSHTINDKLEKLVQNDLYVERKLQTSNNVVPGPDLSTDHIPFSDNGYKIWDRLSGDDEVQIFQKVDTPIEQTVVQDLAGVDVNFIVQYGGKWLAGTSDGIYMSQDCTKWERPSEQVMTNYFAGQNVNCFFSNPDFQMQHGIFNKYQYYIGLKKTELTSGMDDTATLYFLGTNSSGLPEWQPVIDDAAMSSKTEKITHTVNFIKYLEDEECLYVGCYDGLYFVKSRTTVIDNHDYYSPYAEKDEYIASANDMVICPSLEYGRYIIATDNGLMQSNYSLGLKDKKKIIEPSGLITSIYMTEAGTLYYAVSNMVFSYESNGTPICIAELPATVIVNAIAQSYTTMFFGTTSGIFMKESSRDVVKLSRLSEAYADISNVNVKQIDVFSPSSSTFTYVVAATTSGLYYSVIGDLNKWHQICSTVSVNKIIQNDKTLDLATSRGYRIVELLPEKYVIEQAETGIVPANEISLMKRLDVRTDTDVITYMLVAVGSTLYQYYPSSQTFAKRCDLSSSRIVDIAYSSATEHQTNCLMILTEKKLFKASLDFTDVAEVVWENNWKLEHVSRFDQFIIVQTAQHGYVYFNADTFKQWNDLTSSSSINTSDLVEFNQSMYSVQSGRIIGLSVDMTADVKLEGALAREGVGDVNDIQFLQNEAAPDETFVKNRYIYDTSSGRWSVLSSSDGTAVSYKQLSALKNISLVTEVGITQVTSPVTIVADQNGSIHFLDGSTGSLESDKLWYWKTGESSFNVGSKVNSMEVFSDAYTLGDWTESVKVLLGTDNGLKSISYEQQFNDEPTAPANMNNIVFASGIGDIGSHIAATDAGIYYVDMKKSGTDYNATFTQITGTQTYKVHDIIVGADGYTLSALTNKGLYVSTSNKSPLKSADFVKNDELYGDIIDYTVYDLNNQTLFLVHNSTEKYAQIYVYEDGFASIVYTDNNADTYIENLQLEIFKNYCYLGKTNGLYKSLSGQYGEFSSSPVGGITSQVNCIETDDNTLFIATVNGLYTSEDGVTFSRILAGNNISKIRILEHTEQGEDGLPNKVKDIFVISSSNGSIWKVKKSGATYSTQVFATISDGLRNLSYIPFIEQPDLVTREQDSFGQLAMFYFASCATVKKSKVQDWNLKLSSDQIAITSHAEISQKVNKLQNMQLNGINKFTVASTENGVYVIDKEFHVKRLCADLANKNIKIVVINGQNIFALSEDYVYILESAVGKDFTTNDQLQLLSIAPLPWKSQKYQFLPGDLIQGLGPIANLFKLKAASHLVQHPVRSELSSITSVQSIQSMDMILSSDTVDIPIDSIFVYTDKETYLYTISQHKYDQKVSADLTRSTYSPDLSDYTATKLVHYTDGHFDSILSGQFIQAEMFNDQLLFLKSDSSVYGFQNCKKIDQISSANVISYSLVAPARTSVNSIADFNAAYFGTTKGVFTAGIQVEMKDTRLSSSGLDGITLNDITIYDGQQLFASNEGILKLDGKKVAFDGKMVSQFYKVGTDLYINIDGRDLYLLSNGILDTYLKTPSERQLLAISAYTSNFLVCHEDGIYTGSSFDNSRYFMQPYTSISVMLEDLNTENKTEDDDDIFYRVNQIYRIDDSNILFAWQNGLKFYKDALIVRSYYGGILDSSPLLSNVQNMQVFYKDSADTTSLSSMNILHEGELYKMDEHLAFAYKTLDMRSILNNDNVDVKHIIKFDDKTYVIGTNYGIYSTNSKYTWKENIDSFNLRELSVQVTNSFESALDSHRGSLHAEDDVVTKLSKKLDTQLNNISDTLTQVNDTGIETIVHNDIVESVEFNGRVQYIQAAVKNWFTDQNVGDKFDDEGYVNKYSIDKEFKVDLYNVSYIIKNWRSGLKEIYVFVPTTLTFYNNHPEGIGKCRYSGQAKYKNNSATETTNSLDKSKTSLKLLLDNDHLRIASINSIQINGNSLPLKIYKETDDSCGNMTGLYHSVAQPSLVKELFISKDGNWNNNVEDNVNKSTDVLTLMFDVYGTDAQAIKIMATCYTTFQIEFLPGTAPDGTPVTGIMSRQTVNSNAITQLIPCAYHCNGYINAGWKYTIDGVEHTVENLGTIHDLPIKDGETIQFTAVWQEYRFSLGNDTVIELTTDDAKHAESEGNSLGISSYKMIEGYNDIVADFNIGTLA